MTSAIPDTMADMRKTIGISTLLHHGFAFTDPKINPTYPWRRNADGIPMMVIVLMALLSNSTPFSLTSFENKDGVRWSHFTPPFSASAHTIRSLRYSNQISRISTPIRYQAYTKPNIAIADWSWGVRNIS